MAAVIAALPSLSMSACRRAGSRAATGLAGRAPRQALKPASLACIDRQPSSVSVAVSSPNSGATAALWSAPSFPAHAGLTPPVSGSGRPASMRARGKPETSSTVTLRSSAAMARYSSSLRFNATRARSSKAARRHRAKKSSTLLCTAATASAAAPVAAPSGWTSSPPAAAQATTAAASAKNASSWAWSTPWAPPRSVAPPSVSTMSVAKALSSSVSSVSAGTTPSPLWALFDSASAALATSATDRALPSRPRSAEICLAVASRLAPSSSFDWMAASLSGWPPFASASSDERRAVHQPAAAITSGARMRPSLSWSSSPSVASSKASPFTGQASAAHSFWSREPRFAKSAAVSIFAWWKPPRLVKVQV